MVGLTWWSRLAAVARTASRTTADANPIWGGVHASGWGVSMHQKGVSTYQLPIGLSATLGDRVRVMISDFDA